VCASSTGHWRRHSTTASAPHHITSHLTHLFVGILIRNDISARVKLPVLQCAAGKMQQGGRKVPQAEMLRGQWRMASTRAPPHSGEHRCPGDSVRRQAAAPPHCYQTAPRTSCLRHRAVRGARGRRPRRLQGVEGRTWRSLGSSSSSSGRGWGWGRGWRKHLPGRRRW
jgi:hypothetical protein